MQAKKRKEPQTKGQIAHKTSAPIITNTSKESETQIRIQQEQIYIRSQISSN